LVEKIVWTYTLASDCGIVVRMNGPFRAIAYPLYRNPGLRPGLTESALQAEGSTTDRAPELNWLELQIEI
jgi:hypothetical protein